MLLLDEGEDGDPDEDEWGHGDDEEEYVDEHEGE